MDAPSLVRNQIVAILVSTLLLVSGGGLAHLSTSVSDQSSSSAPRHCKLIQAAQRISTNCCQHPSGTRSANATRALSRCCRISSAQPASSFSTLPRSSSEEFLIPLQASDLNRASYLQSYRGLQTPFLIPNRSDSYLRFCVLRI